MEHRTDFRNAPTSVLHMHKLCVSPLGIAFQRTTRRRCLEFLNLCSDPPFLLKILMRSLKRTRCESVSLRECPKTTIGALCREKRDYANDI